MKARFDATGGVLLVTGGASGIGAALAQAYAEAGGKVVIIDTAVRASAPGRSRIEYHQVDVADRDAVMRCVAEVTDRHGHIDALVAGAAIQPRCAVVSMDPEQWRRTLAVNLDGVVWASQAVLPQMIERRAGVILVFSSGLARMGRAEASAYAASKGALISYATSLAAEVAPYRVRVNVIFPGVIDTPQFQLANPAGGEREHWARTTGIGTPADVVGPLMFMLSDAATVTGSLLTRDRAYSREVR